MTTHIQPISRLRMCGVILYSPYINSWRLQEKFPISSTLAVFNKSHVQFISHELRKQNFALIKQNFDWLLWVTLNNNSNIIQGNDKALTFVCPCIVSIIVNDDQQDATFWFIYLFVPNQLYIFRAMFSSIIRST